MIQRNIIDKNSQTNKDHPLYVITCLDNMVNPIGNIDIKLLHFISDSYAIGWSKEYAAQQGWHSWEIFEDVREVYFVNTNLKTERINREEVV